MVYVNQDGTIDGPHGKKYRLRETWPTVVSEPKATNTEATWIKEADRILRRLVLDEQSFGNTGAKPSGAVAQAVDPWEERTDSAAFTPELAY